MKRNGNAEDEAPRSRAAGARIEAPRGWAWGGGVPLPTGGRGLGRRRAPPEKKKLTLALNMVSFGAFWMVFFTVQLPVLNAKPVYNSVLCTIEYCRTVCEIFDF